MDPAYTAEAKSSKRRSKMIDHHITKDNHILCNKQTYEINRSLFSFEDPFRFSVFSPCLLALRLYASILLNVGKTIFFEKLS